MLFHFSLPLILPPPLQNFLLDRTQRIACVCCVFIYRKYAHTAIAVWYGNGEQIVFYSSSSKQTFRGNINKSELRKRASERAQD